MAKLKLTKLDVGELLNILSYMYYETELIILT